MEREKKEEIEYNSQSFDLSNLKNGVAASFCGEDGTGGGCMGRRRG